MQTSVPFSATLFIEMYHNMEEQLISGRNLIESINRKYPKVEEKLFKPRIAKTSRELVSRKDCRNTLKMCNMLLEDPYDSKMFKKNSEKNNNPNQLNELKIPERISTQKTFLKNKSKSTKSYAHFLDNQRGYIEKCKKKFEDEQEIEESTPTNPKPTENNNNNNNNDMNNANNNKLNSKNNNNNNFKPMEPTGKPETPNKIRKIRNTK